MINQYQRWPAAVPNTRSIFAFAFTAELQVKGANSSIHRYRESTFKLNAVQISK
jgi:hypothetical protein